MTRRAGRTDLRRAGFVLFGVWALVHIAVFSTQQGIFHPYYVSALAPALAALAAGGIALLVPAARRSWSAAGVLAAAIAVTAALSIYLLARTPDFAPWVKGLVFAAGALAIGGVAAWRLNRHRALLAVAAVCGALALSAGPAAYSIATASHALNGNDVSAGPASASGGMRGGGFGGDAVDAELIAYLQANRDGAKYLVAVTGSQASAPIIIETGEAVVTIGGFGGGDPAPTVDQLAQMVADGELKYVLVGGGGMGGGPGGRGASSELTAWIEEHGTAVEGVGSGNGTLYELA